MGKCKLTNEQKEEIKYLYLTGKYSYKSLGKIYNISPVSIIRIVNPKRNEEIRAYFKNYEATREPNCNCIICDKPIYIQKCRLNAKIGHACSKECRSLMFSKFRIKENSPSYGLTGEKSSRYKSGKFKNKIGYILVLSKNHPFRDKNDYVYEHRLVIEENFNLFDKSFFIELNGKMYLKKTSIVHHINEIKDDNRISNLTISSKSTHSQIHATENIKKRKRDEFGRLVKGD